MVTGALFLGFLTVAFIIGSICERLVPKKVWDEAFKLFGIE